LFSDYYMNGRKEFAEGLLDRINRWEKADDWRKKRSSL
jgi:hypothetical protein